MEELETVVKQDVHFCPKCNYRMTSVQEMYDSGYAQHLAMRAIWLCNQCGYRQRP